MIRVECCNFLNLYGRYVLQHEQFLKNFLLIDPADRNKICSDQNRLFFTVSLYPFHYSRTLPLKQLFITKNTVFMVSVANSQNIFAFIEFGKLILFLNLGHEAPSKSRKCIFLYLCDQRYKKISNQKLMMNICIA